MKLRMGLWWVACVALISVVLLPVVHAGPGGFVYTGNMARSRLYHTATVVTNGKVLIAGGTDLGGDFWPQGELYDPTTGTFTSTGTMNVPRTSHTATLLNNGMVLIVGGDDANSNALASAELYNPATGTFTATGSLSTTRRGHTATLLANGMVLIAGGSSDGIAINCVETAELYNPAAGTFTSTGNMTSARCFFTATLLNNGKVLMAGGYGNPGAALSSAELYNPATGSFGATGSMKIARTLGYQGTTDYGATLLNNGMVLVMGGQDANFNATAEAELYNPSSGAFSVTGSLNKARYAFTSTLLNNGEVLVAGGLGAAGTNATAELYIPAMGGFALTGALNEGRSAAAAALLDNGQVLVSGGAFNSTTAELYQPSTLTPSGLQSISLSPTNPSVPAGSAMRFTATGNFGGGGQHPMASATWSSSKNAVATVTSDTTNYGNAYGVASGNTTITACAGSICGSTVLTVFTDGADFATGTSTTMSTSVTPTLSNDFAVVVLGTQSTIGQTSPILPPGYTSISADGHTTIAYKQLTSTATESPSNTINSAQWAEGLVLLVTKTGSSAAFRSTSVHETTGSISAPTQTLAPPNPYLAGSTVLVCLRADRINTNGAPPTITKITDSLSNTYVRFGAVAIGGAPGGADGAAVEIWGAINVAAGRPTITVTIGGNGGWSGTLGAYEFTGVL